MHAHIGCAITHSHAHVPMTHTLAHIGLQEYKKTHVQQRIRTHTQNTLANTKLENTCFNMLACACVRMRSSTKSESNAHTWPMRAALRMCRHALRMCCVQKKNIEIKYTRRACAYGACRIAHERWCTYADVCWRMLTYADVCWRRTCADGACRIAHERCCKGQSRKRIRYRCVYRYAQVALV